MEEVGGVKQKSKRKGSRFGKRYGFEFKLRCVKLRLEEGLPVTLLSKEVGASKNVIGRWVKAYREREKLVFVTKLFPRGAGGSFPVQYARRSLRSRSVSPSLVSSGFPIF